MHKLRTIHLFSGAGGGILADILLGHATVCAVEIEPYCWEVLHARQQDGCIPWFPIFKDVKTFDGKQWRGLVDIVAGGFPCQDISVAGNGSGIKGERSGLWKEMLRVVSEVRPRYVFVENSPAILVRGFGIVLGDLAALGYDAKWGVFSAADIGARHERARLWCVAYSDKTRHAVCNIQKKFIRQKPQNSELVRVFRTTRKTDNPLHMRKSDEMAVWMDRFAAIGNGQCPAVVELAWKTLSNE